ncbi:alpha-glucosidase [Persicobacter diffluens]|uniref:Alpha-glucosidase n=2 Tax=Persicobacter diffluens TaxID=981 RepID=A0AAN4W3U5_9BACT|nr:alpha-glucosidase [Persicobacter diffluens]
MACSPLSNSEKFNITMESPEGHFSVNIYLKYGLLHYAVLNQSEEVVMGPSSLGIKTDRQDYTTMLRCSKQEHEQDLLENMVLISGKKTNRTAIYHQSKFTFVNSQEREMVLEVRTFQDGFAFRYFIPEHANNWSQVQEESTEFYFPQGGLSWLQPYDQASEWTPAYENIYEEYKMASPSPTQNGWCLPALFDSGNKYFLISESGPFTPYAAMHLAEGSKKELYRLAWPDAMDANGLYDAKPRIQGDITTPWRCITITEDLSTLFSSDLVNLVAPPPVSGDTDWIATGLSSWSWLTDHDSPQDFEKLKPYIDLSARMQWPYALIDANWDNMSNGSIEEVIQYAEERDVGLFLWYNSGGKHNVVTEAPRNLLHDAYARKKEFERLQKWGVKGIKVDFFQSDKKEIMALYLDILKDAMDYHLMVNFHGCTIPRGWARMYPNLITMEAVRGEEVYYFGKNFPQKAPVANCILPFTRNVVGSMDYTPTVFTTFDHPHLTTMGHELALALIFESGVQHMGDSPEMYDALPIQTRELLSELPASWEESRLLQARIGKEVIVARRSGNAWYVAGINGEDFPKTWKLNLGALQKFGAFNFSTDTPSLTGVSVQKIAIQSSNAVRVSAYGGFLGKIELPS